MLDCCTQERVLLNAMPPHFHSSARCVVSEPGLESARGAGITKALSLVMIALIVVAVVYATWIVIVNWNYIGV